MAYMTMALTLFLAAWLIPAHWHVKTQLTMVTAVFLLTTVGLLFSQIPFDDGVILKGSPDATRNAFTILHEVGLYVVMLLGMMAKYMHDWFRKEQRTSFNMRVFISPFFVSPIVFTAIYTSAGEYAGTTWLLWLFAFQNGFFWQTMFDR